MTNLTSILGGGAIPTWVSGSSYLVDDNVWSSVSGHCYRCIVNTSGTTDPSSDATNWKLIGPGGIKSIQRGTVAINSGSTSGTATLSPAVVVANTELRVLGTSVNTDVVTGMIRVSLTNTTTVTATRGADTSNTSTVAWEVTERWA